MKRIYIKYTKELLTTVVKESRSVRDLMLKLGLRACGGNYKIMSARLNRMDIDISHFSGAGWRKGMKGSYLKIDLSKVLSKDSKYSTGSPYQSFKVKKLLYDNGLKKKECESCGITEWLGGLIVFELHHIDGNSFNNELENLQILCPNCHSITENFRGKNIKKVKKVKIPTIKKEKEHKEKEPKLKKERKLRINNRKVKERPTVEYLINEVRLLGYRGTGKKYGVSDNAVRKWIKVK